MESKGSKASKSQLHITRGKDKSLSIANSFSMLDVEQKESILKDFHPDSQKELHDLVLHNKVEHSARSSVPADVTTVSNEQNLSTFLKLQPISSKGNLQNTTNIGVSSVPDDVTSNDTQTNPGVFGFVSECATGSDFPAPAAESLSEFLQPNSPGLIEKAGFQDSGRKEVAGSVAPVLCCSKADFDVAPAVGDKVEVSAALEVCRSEAESVEPPRVVRDLAVEQPSHLGSFGVAEPRQSAAEVCSSGAIEETPADVASSGQIGELAPVGSMTQACILSPSSPPKSWANMVEEEEQEAKNFALLKANFNERVAQKDHNEGLALKNNTKTPNRVDTKRYISKDDSQVDEFSFSQGNPRTDLPPALGKYFISPEGIEIDLNECKEAGYRLIARRSLSPPGRSSPKLISLRKKVICGQTTLVQDFKGYSAEFLAEVERARSSKNYSPRDKLPTPNGPGQSRQRRNRGRNRYSYGTPDQPPRYRGKGSH
ncbi:hypothetical protein LIER_43602 [Lithospermum erythrorhizon]|uniref:Uncharacterized protein n=1 Tax=Lithospermum erythrorhizon TaxID=34254 RepID=A0AAV3QGM2_LITER